MTQKIVVSKPTYNTITDTDPSHLIFSSDYGTLNYYTKGTTTIEIDNTSGVDEIAGANYIIHNLGYYPYVEVYTRVYIGSPTGNYQPCPFAGAGASVFYGATYKIGTTGISLYAEISGFSNSIWTFDFIYFIFRNNLDL